MKAGSENAFRPQGRARQRLALVSFFFLVIGIVVLMPSNATSAGQSPIEDAKLSQAGKSLILQVRSSENVNLGKLDRRPDFARTRHAYLCLEMSLRGHRTVSRICLGGKKRPYHSIGVSRTSPAGKVKSSQVLDAKVRKVDGTKLVVTFDPREANLPAGGYDWRIADHAAGCRETGRLAKPATDCLTHFPARHHARYELRRIQAVGCAGGNGDVVRQGPGGRRLVALTFDDGPSDYTPDVLRVLRKKHAKATFFMLGQQVARYPDYARKVLAAGHEIANHSYDHDLLPSGSNIRHATRTIKDVTGFRTCLFRPPYGAINESLRRSVGDDKMKSVIWDVDTTDWKLPGSASIRSTIIHRVRPGSIVLMHDGGGPRGGTVDALSGAISGLRGRGYELVTVSELLGDRMIYRPVK